jgi:hypothetical protein
VLVSFQSLGTSHGEVSVEVRITTVGTAPTSLTLGGKLMKGKDGQLESVQLVIKKATAIILINFLIFFFLPISLPMHYLPIQP